jgi:hypothetical protein
LQRSSFNRKGRTSSFHQEKNAPVMDIREFMKCWSPLFSVRVAKENNRCARVGIAKGADPRL